MARQKRSKVKWRYREQVLDDARNLLRQARPGRTTFMQFEEQWELEQMRDACLEVLGTEELPKEIRFLIGAPVARQGRRGLNR